MTMMEGRVERVTAKKMLGGGGREGEFGVAIPDRAGMMRMMTIGTAEDEIDSFFARLDHGRVI